MKNLKSNQNEVIETNQSEVIDGIQKKIEETLANLKNPTKESAEKALAEVLARPASIDDIVPFTGYYGMSTAENAFFTIDTSELYYTYVLTQKITLSLTIPTVTINVSLDGQTSTQYQFDQSVSFDGKTLIIPGILQLDFTRTYQDGILITFYGTINNVPVDGSTNFNPVSLPIFIGNYMNVLTGKTILTVDKGSIMYDFGSGLENIPVFTYNPAMYVVQFTNSGIKYTLMLGTAAQNGLACFITDGTNNSFAVTIL